jgi:hypothetical protein
VHLDWLVGWLVGWLVVLVGWLVGCLAGWLVGMFVVKLVEWLASCLVAPCAGAAKVPVCLISNIGVNFPKCNERNFTLDAFEFCCAPYH